MLLKNDLLSYTLPRARTVRVLWIDASLDLAYTYELHAKRALPERVSVRVLLEDLGQQRAQRHADAARLAGPGLEVRPPKHLALRDRAWQIISGLPLDQVALFKPQLRGALITQQSAAHGVSYPSVYRYLRRFWERGQHIDALLPDYCNSGAPGKTRAANAVKRGRPRKSGDGAGLNADPALRQTFGAAVRRYAEQHTAFCRRAAYRAMIDEFFTERDPAALPSFGQFNYWIEKDACLHGLAATQQNALANRPD